MRHGFQSGSAEAVRLAKRFVEASGRSGLGCVDSQYFVAGQSPDSRREKGLITWTVRFTGLPPGPHDDGSILILVNLESGEARRFGGGKDA